MKSVQAYVDTYGTTPGHAATPTPTATPSPSPSSSGTGVPTGPEGGLTTALADARKQLQQKGCDLTEFRTRFTDAMTTVRARGPVARAVLLRLTASMSGSLGSQAVTRKVKPGQNIETIASRLGAGSTLQLGAGTYRLRHALVLLAGITLRGVGRAKTRVTSSAGGSDVLVLTDGKVTLSRLSLEHVGKKQASVLLGGPSSMIVLDQVRITGGRGGGQSSGGSGVTMTAQAGSKARAVTTLQVTGSDISGNDAAGILLSGGHRASIRTTHFQRDGQCGVCFAANSSGAVRRSTFRDNAVGVAVLDNARPLVRDDTFTDGLVGVQVTGLSEPVIRDVQITGATRAGMIFSNRASGRVDGATCTQVPYGIVIASKAVPLLGKNSCTLARGK